MEWGDDESRIKEEISMCLVFEKDHYCMGAGERKKSQVCVWCPNFIKYRKKRRTIKMETTAIEASLARQEEQIKGLARRMDNLEKLTESVNKLAISVERLTAQQATTDSQIETLTGDVNDLKAKPAKRWDTVIAAIISALIGAGITLLIKG